MSSLSNPINLSPVYTYEVAPVFTLMEKICFEKMYEHLGWNKGEPQQLEDG